MVTNARRWIFETGRSVGSTILERVLGKTSSVPTVVGLLFLLV
jgi:hypothetical protein